MHYIAVNGLCGVLGLRWWAEVSLVFVCLRWLSALVPAFVCLSVYRVSL